MLLLDGRTMRRLGIQSQPEAERFTAAKARLLSGERFG
jgi:hypothetical protein